MKKSCAGFLYGFLLQPLTLGAAIHHFRYAYEWLHSIELTTMRYCDAITKLQEDIRAVQEDELLTTSRRHLTPAVTDDDTP